MIILAFQIGLTALLTALVVLIIGLATTKYPRIQKIVEHVTPACIVTAGVTLTSAMIALIWQA